MKRRVFLNSVLVFLCLAVFGLSPATAEEKVDAPEVEPVVEEILTKIESLTVLQANQLKKAWEHKHGAIASAPVGMVAMAGGGGGGGGEQEEEQTEFSVVLKSFGDKKIQVIKVVREITSLGLKEAKELVDSAPSKVKEGIAKEEAEAIRDKLQDVGAQVEIK